MRFYFDFISPYAYLAWPEVLQLANAHKRELTAVPILFAALLDHYGHLGPAEIPPKRNYVFKNLLRLAHERNRVLVPPPSHPFSPLAALRAASFADDHQHNRITALFDALWCNGEGAGDLDAVQSILGDEDPDGGAIGFAQSDEAKKELRRATEGAIAAGVFGVPTLEIDGELFWGVDSLGHADSFLRGEDPVDPQMVARWNDLPKSASRR